MSDGLDVLRLTNDGSSSDEHVSLVACFGSVSLADKLRSGAYPLLNSVWGYHDTTVQPADVPEIVREAEALLSSCVDGESAIASELGALIRFGRETHRLGSGLIFSGP